MKIIIIAVLFLIFALLIFFPFYVVIEYSKKEKEEYVVVRIKYLFFKIKLNKKKHKKKKGSAAHSGNNEDGAERLKRGIDIFKHIEDDVVDIIRYLAEKAIFMKKLEFFINFGLEEPMSTGIATGTLYGTIYNVISFLNNAFGVEECDVKVNPDFEKKHIDISSKCILKIRNVHIIIVFFKVLKIYFKITKIK